MESLKQLYKIGRGPSSSHTMGPYRAAGEFSALYPQAQHFRVTLFGSLSLTGKGHMTDTVIREAFLPRPVEIIFAGDAPEGCHPNTMDLEALEQDLVMGQDAVIGKRRVFSVGGGSIVIEGEPLSSPPRIYPQSSFDETAQYCKAHNLRIWQVVEQVEGPDIWSYLQKIWDQMKRSIETGLRTEGVLAGGLEVQRKAYYLYSQRHIDESAQTRENRMVCAYAFAVNEENASSGLIVTAPTCGASGVLPAVLKYMQEQKGFSDQEILRALATGGFIGNLYKTNASISGAEAGCMAEVGVACSMAAAALAELFDMGLKQIEYAAEVAMEHHLGLTCDPIRGLVQIPCIERNAVAAMRAINALSLSNFLADTQKISLDTVITTMFETGKHLSFEYRETSQGGLAKYYTGE